MSRPTRILAAVAVFALGATALTACDAATEKLDPPVPTQTIEGLTRALTTGDFTGLSFTASTPDEVTTSYDDVTTDLTGAGLTPQVTTGRVKEAGSTAEVALTWTWPIGEDEAWTYDTTADLARTGDTWAVTWDPSVIEPSLTAASTLDLTSIAPQRGEILGADRQPIVVDRPVVRIGIDRTQVGPTRVIASARSLARLLDIDVPPYLRRVKASGKRSFVEAVTYRRGEVPRPVALGYPGIKGARGLSDQLALAPSRDFGVGLLGRVGPVTAQMVKDDPINYQPGDVAGLSGLEQRYDARLRGVPGAVVDAVGADGKPRELFRAPPVRGEPLQLTLDVAMQARAEKLLAGVGPASALVAIRPSTGEVLTAANGPGANGYDVATYGQYPPGSTFKIVSSLALLRAGLTPGSPVPCTSSVVVDGRSFTNYSDYPVNGLGDIPLRTAVANSCNTAFISQAPKVKGTGLYDAAASLGLGIDHDLGFPAYFGNVQQPETATEKAAVMIGQGTILASPMVMATVIASVQAGDLVVPRMVDGVEVAKPDGAQPLTAQEAGQLHSMLRGVVTDGSGRGLVDLPGPPAIAKTGTAEFEKGGKTLTHAWMVAAQGDLAVAVFVDRGSSGSGTAGPILEAFLRGARGRK